jgi:uncharacterized repeat protein (TIGR02543 family)
MTVNYDQDINPPTDPTREGYTFNGWDPNIPETMPEEDLLLTALWEINQYTLSFDRAGGSAVPSITADFGAPIDPPTDPIREGYTFSGWDPNIPNTMPAHDLELTALWEINQYTLTFDSDGGSHVSSITENYQTPLIPPDDPVKEDYTFVGWFENPDRTSPYTFDLMPAFNQTLYALWQPASMSPMVFVGDAEHTYTIPIGLSDSATAQVQGGYYMATTETTYELWYEVRIWAESNGYSFQNPGREGNNGAHGAQPTISRTEPVTSISWRDTVVWLNALSEMTGLSPVYRTSHGPIIRDSRDANGSVVDAALQTDNNGYRLPTSDEWEMAARWTNDTTSTHGSILRSGRYWTPGDYASGATADYNHESETSLVAWYAPNSNMRTNPNGTKTPNALGIYDMNGNVWEWTFTPSGANRILRGGSYLYTANAIVVSFVADGNAYGTDMTSGFRITRNP